MKARLRAIVLALLAGSAGALAGTPLEASLHAPTDRPDRLYVVLFSLPDCAYCVPIRNAYLPALPDDPRFGARVRIREIVIGSPRLLADFDGKPARHADLAHRYGVKFAPTVLFLDARGAARAAPLPGGDGSGLYGGYLESRVLQALDAGAAAPR